MVGTTNVYTVNNMQWPITRRQNIPTQWHKRTHTHTHSEHTRTSNTHIHAQTCTPTDYTKTHTY